MNQDQYKIESQVNVNPIEYTNILAKMKEQKAKEKLPSIKQVRMGLGKEQENINNGKITYNQQSRIQQRAASEGGKKQEYIDNGYKSTRYLIDQVRKDTIPEKVARIVTDKEEKRKQLQSKRD